MTTTPDDEKLVERGSSPNLYNELQEDRKNK